MAEYHLGSFKSINAFVQDKLASFRQMGYSFETLFALMFREEENVLYEQSEGYRIRKTTYGEAKRHILERAQKLRRLTPELGQDDVIGLYMENSLDWIELFWTIIAAGYRPLLMNTRLARPLLEDAMRSANCRAVIGSVEKTGFSCPVIDPDAICTGDDTAAGTTGLNSFGTELLVMSSGTTENVKVCAYGAEEFYYQIADSFEIIRTCPTLKKHYNGELKLLTFLPFYHVFGLIAMYIWFAFFSRTFVHLPDMAPQTIVNTIKRHKVTHIFAVPLFWEKVYEQAMRGIRDRGEKTVRKFERGMKLWKKLPHPLDKAFSRIAFGEVRDNLFGDSIKFMITGGSFIDSAVPEFFNCIGYRLANGYGMTEIGITSVELSPKKKYLLGGSIGSPMSNAEYMINESGELLVRGKVIARYVISGGEKREREGWYDTRDLAECEDGHYRLLGRRDDLIIGSGGENLNPNLIEPLLKTAGAELCLIPVSDNGHISPVLLAGVNRHLPAEKLDAIRAELTEKIHAAGLAGTISKVVLTGEELKKTDEFKLNRIRLSRDYSSGKIAPLDTSSKHGQSETDELVRHICELFSAFTKRPEEEISEESDFFIDLGGTSIDYFALLTRLRDEYSAAFPIDLNFHTPGQVAAYIREDAGGKSVR